MKKKWLIALCAFLLTLCVALSAAGAETRGVSALVGEYDSWQTLMYSFSMAGNALAVVGEEGCALVGADGETLVPAGLYDAMEIPSGREDMGLFIVSRQDGGAARCGVIDCQGRETVPARYDGVKCYSVKWQAGLVAEEAAPEEADFSQFSPDGVRYYRVVSADVYYDGKLIAILEGDTFSMEARAYGNYLYFEHATLTARGKTLDYSDDPAYSMDKEYGEKPDYYLHFGSGGEAFSPFCTLRADEVEKTLLHVENGLFRDLQGNLIRCGEQIKYRAQEPIQVSNGLTVIQDGAYLGLMDESGHIVAPCVYDEIMGGSSARDTLMASGYQAVVKNDQLGYLDAAGAEASAFDLDYSPLIYGPSVNSPFAFWQDRETGGYIVYTAAAGRLPGEYEDVVYPNSGAAQFLAVRQDGAYGVIDLYGNAVIPFGYQEILLSYDGALAACDAGGGLALYRLEYADVFSTVRMILHYVDEAGKAVAPDSAYEVGLGVYNISPEGPIPGWALISEDPAVVSVDGSADTVEVAFVYRPITAELTVRYVDEDGKEIAEPAVLTLEAGAYRITPAKGAVSEEEYQLTGPEEYVVTIDENGASMPEVTFAYAAVVRPVDVTVRYVDENGAEIADGIVLTLEAGTYRINPAKGAVSEEDYTLTGSGSYDVTIDKNGASMAEVVFTYATVIHTADVTVRYVDEDGKEIADPAILTLEAGAYRITPAKNAVSEEEYTLTGSGSYDVTIDKNGASMSEIVFTFEQVIHTADVTVRYMDVYGREIAEPAVLTLQPGTYRINPAQDAVSEADYTLNGAGAYEVTVDKNGASMSEVVFTYAPVIRTVDVTVRYVDETGREIDQPDVLTLKPGTYRISPDAENVSKEDYQLLGDGVATVTVDKNGASATEIVFTYAQVIHTADVTVRYVDETGREIDQPDVLTLKIGTYRITPDAENVSSNVYQLISNEVVTVTVDKNGASVSEVVFTYRQMVYPAMLTVNYVDEQGQPVAQAETIMVDPGVQHVTAHPVGLKENYVLAEGESDTQTVIVTADGANPRQLTFVYTYVGPRSTVDLSELAGVNLLVDSTRARASKGGFLEIPVADCLAPYVGMPIVVSFEIQGTPGQQILIDAYQSSGVSIAPPVNNRQIRLTKNGYARYYFCTTVWDYGKQTGKTAGSIAFWDQSGQNQEFSVRLVKIEVGDQMTDWSIAPNDPLVTTDYLFDAGDDILFSEEGLLLISLGDSLWGYEDMQITVFFGARGYEEKDILVFSPDYGVSIADNSEACLILPLTEEEDVYWFDTTVRSYSQDDSGVIAFIDIDDDYIDFEITFLYIDLDL